MCINETLMFIQTLVGIKLQMEMNSELTAVEAAHHVVNTHDFKC